MKLSLIVVLALTALAVSACVVEPIGGPGYYGGPVYYGGCCYGGGDYGRGTWHERR